jgi:hypothetical protein
MFSRIPSKRRRMHKFLTELCPAITKNKDDKLLLFCAHLQVLSEFEYTIM